jgi:CHASE2 domain-containing sensor protein
MRKYKEEIVKYGSIILCVVVVLLMSCFRVFETYELQTFDLRFKARPTQKTNPDIVIIEISEDSIARLGAWPFDRIFHAYLISALHEAGAKMAVYDVLFAEPSEHDDYLIKAVKDYKRAYFPYCFVLDDSIKDEVTASSFEDLVIKRLDAVDAGDGHINIDPDIDGKNRKVPLYIRLEDKYYPHLALTALIDYYGLKEEEVVLNKGDSIKLGDKVTIPLNNRNEVMINYAGPWKKTFKHYSFVEVLDAYSYDESKGPRDKDALQLSELKDKVCFVAVTATGLWDLQPMPLEERYPAVGVHMNVFNSVTTDNFIVRVDRWVNVLILLFLSLIVIYFSRYSIYKGLALNIIALSLFIAAAFALFIFFNIWINLFYPAALYVFLYLGMTFYGLLIEKHRAELMGKELEVARRIQQSFLPQEPLKIEGFQVAANMNAAKQVGGDLYQFIKLNDNKFGIFIADVSGKGIPASLFMVSIVSEFKAWAGESDKPDIVLKNINNELLKGAKTGLFVTVSYPIIDAQTKKVILSDGGHLPLMHYKAASKEVVEERPTKGMPLGLMPNVDFNEKEFSLASGDILAFYTDGVSEARNLKKEEYGFTRIKDVISANYQKDAQGILDALRDDISKFCGKAPQHDDITAIILKVQ